MSSHMLLTCYHTRGVDTQLQVARQMGKATHLGLNRPRISSETFLTTRACWDVRPNFKAKRTTSKLFREKSPNEPGPAQQSVAEARAWFHQITAFRKVCGKKKKFMKFQKLRPNTPFKSKWWNDHSWEAPLLSPVNASDLAFTICWGRETSGSDAHLIPGSENPDGGMSTQKTNSQTLLGD